MDLFDLLVRLDALGWKSHPPRDAVDPILPDGLRRLLHKASAIERDGERYDFNGLAAPSSPLTGAGLRCIALEPRPVWLVPHGDDCAVVAFPERGPVVLATHLAGFLQLLVEPVAVGEMVAVPLGELGFEGEGWGWQLSALETPCWLYGLPDHLANEPLQAGADALWAGHRVLEPVAIEHTSQETQDVDPELAELFGGSGRARPRTGLVAGLLIGGVLTTILGMACIAAPGGLLVLLAWLVVEKDHDRVESGYLPEADRSTVERSRNLTHAGLMLVICLFFVQALLLCFGGYDPLLDDVYIPLWRSFVGSLLGPGETDPPL